MPLNTRTSPLVAVAVATVATSAVLVGFSAAQARRPDPTGPATASPASSRIQGPPIRPATVLDQSRHRITCPAGSEPTVDIENARFEPALVRGTRFGARTYRIILTGSVVNETNSPIDVSGVGLAVGGTPWHPSVSRPGGLGPGEGQPLVIRGSYRSTRPQHADVAAYLRWRWSDHALRVCGTKGLIKDD